MWDKVGHMRSLKRCALIALGFILTLGGLNAPSAFATGPGNIQPTQTITSADGNVSIGVNGGGSDNLGTNFGGSIVYLTDNRIPGGGNLVNNGQAGAFFQTAMWTFPNNLQELTYCDASRLVWYAPYSMNICEDWLNSAGVNTGIPLHNPTQGGFEGYGLWGNPNPSTVSVDNQGIHVSYRDVNYNFDRPQWELTSQYASEWQTNWWGDVDIYFHPNVPDVIVVDTKMTYCKDMDPSCPYSTDPNNPMENTTQDNQLSTFFADPSTYNRSVNMQSQNWVGILQPSADYGVGMSILNYASTDSSRFGINSAGSVMSGIQPKLTNFTNSGLSSWTTDILRYQFRRGDWYKFRTFVATGDLSTIGQNLLKAQNSYFGYAPYGDDAQFVSQNVPTTVVAGQPFNATVTMKNTGATTWTASGPNPYRLGGSIAYPPGQFNPDAFGTASRTDVPTNVSPGNTVQFNVALTAPSTPGTYTFGRQMVWEQKEWFGAYSPPVNFTVVAPTPPTANPMSVTTPYNTPTSITLTGTDPNNLPLTYSVTTSPTHGTLSGTAPNVTYTPTSGYSGTDSFTFKVNNGAVDSSNATVAITVSAQGCIPDNSCATQTCTGSTCQDNCGNTYQGTQTCTIPPPPQPDLSALNGHIFKVTDNLKITYNNAATGFEWQLVSVSGSGAPQAFAASASTQSPIPTTAPQLALQPLSLTPGIYNLNVRAVNAGEFSTWAKATITLVSAVVSTNLDGVRIHPNPVRVSRGDVSVIIDQMPANSQVKLFTVSGHWIKTLDAPSGFVSWDLTNDSGDRVASGIYLYLIDSPAGKKTGQIHIVK